MRGSTISIDPRYSTLARAMNRTWVVGRARDTTSIALRRGEPRDFLRWSLRGASPRRPALLRCRPRRGRGGREPPVLTRARIRAVRSDPAEWWQDGEASTRVWLQQMRELGGGFPWTLVGDVHAMTEGSVGWAGAAGGVGDAERAARLPPVLRPAPRARRVEDRPLPRVGALAERGTRLPADDLGRRHRRVGHELAAGPVGHLRRRRDRDDRVHRHRGLDTAERPPRATSGGSTCCAPTTACCRTRRPNSGARS